MSAMSEILGYLVQTLLGLYIFAVLLRFLLQAVRADFYNPISQFLVKATNPLVLPLRRVVPGLGGLDLSSLLLALVLQMLLIAVLGWLRVGFVPNFLVLFAASSLGLAALLVNIYFFAILATIILSFISPGGGHPIIYLLYQITEPVLAPFRKLLPPMGGLDFSPIFAFILLQVINILLRHAADAAGAAGWTLWL